MLDSILRDAVARRYPGISLTERARFFPMLDLSRGEISSTAAIEIARVTRENAESIARTIVPDLAPHAAGEWRTDLGYLVLANADAHTLIPQARTLAEEFPAGSGAPQMRDIVCLTPDVTSPLYARLRLVALTALQAILSVSFEGQSRVTIAPGNPRVVSSRAEVLELVRESVERLLAEETAERRSVEGTLDGVERGRTTVYTAHHYHDSLAAPSKRYLQELKAQEAINLRMPGDGWLMSRERALTELLSSPALRGVLKHLSGDDAWMRWLFHAASSIPSGDLDPMVALFDECASPLWSVRALAERFEHLTANVPKLSERAALSSIQSLAGPQRALLLRGVFLPVWSGRAVREGEALAWMAVVEELAASGHAFLNRPETRRELLAAPHSPEIIDILAGLGFGLSSILPVVSEGSCRDHMHTTAG